MDDATLMTVGQASRLPRDEDRQAGGLPHDETPPEFVGEAPRKSKRRQTAHLKLVPQDKPLREKLQARAAEGLFLCRSCLVFRATALVMLPVRLVSVFQRKQKARVRVFGPARSFVTVAAVCFAIYFDRTANR